MLISHLPFEPQEDLAIISTSSFTASADFLRAACSSTVNSNSIISSTPDFPNFTEYYSLDDRLNNSDVVWGEGGENVAVINCEGLSDNIDMAKKVLKMWINSPKHHELLLSTNYKYGAVSARYSKTWVKGDNSDFWNYITMNVYR